MFASIPAPAQPGSTTRPRQTQPAAVGTPTRVARAHTSEKNKRNEHSAVLFTSKVQNICDSRGQLTYEKPDSKGASSPAWGRSQRPTKLPLHQLKQLVTAGRASGQSHATITSQIKLCYSWQEAYQLFIHLSPEFNHININALLHRVAKLSGGKAVRPEEQDDFDFMLQELKEFAEQELSNYSARELANTAYSCAKLGLRDRRLLQLIVARSRPQAFKNQELANLVWAFASLDYCPQDTRWLGQCVRELHSRLPHFTNQELSNTLWALAKLHLMPGDAWMSTMCSQLTARVPSFCPQDLANCLWALAALGHATSQPAAQALLHACQPLLHEFSNADLVLLVVALPKLVQAGWVAELPAQLAAGLMVAVQARAGTLAKKPRNAVLVLRGLAQLKIKPEPKVLEELLLAMQHTMHRFNSQDFSLTLWSLASISYCPSAAWMQHFATASLGAVQQQATPQHISNLLWGFASLRQVPPEPWLKAAVTKLMSQLDLCMAQEISISLWALGKLGTHLPFRSLGLLVQFLANTVAHRLLDNIHRPTESSLEDSKHRHNTSSSPGALSIRNRSVLEDAHSAEEFGAGEQLGPGHHQDSLQTRRCQAGGHGVPAINSASTSAPGTTLQDATPTRLTAGTHSSSHPSVGSSIYKSSSTGPSSTAWDALRPWVAAMLQECDQSDNPEACRLEWTYKYQSSSAAGAHSASEEWAGIQSWMSEMERECDASADPGACRLQWIYRWQSSIDPESSSSDEELGEVSILPSSQAAYSQLPGAPGNISRASWTPGWTASTHGTRQAPNSDQRTLVLQAKHVVIAVASLPALVSPQDRALFAEGHWRQLTSLERISYKLLHCCNLLQLYMLTHGFAQLGHVPSQEWLYAVERVAVRKVQEKGGVAGVNAAQVYQRLRHDLARQWGKLHLRTMSQQRQQEEGHEQEQQEEQEQREWRQQEFGQQEHVQKQLVTAG